MATIRSLVNAPIVEAIIDIRVEAQPAFRGEAFQIVRDTIRADFPKVEERRGATWELAFGGPQPKQALREHGVDGFFFRSDDEHTVAQFRVDGFTFNRLAPYTRWDDILPRAVHLFELYLRVAEPRAVGRVATRYINRLSLPSRRFGDYLTQPPLGVPGTGGALLGFMDAASVMDGSDGMSVNFTQACGNLQGDSPVVILDIDAYIIGTFDPRADEVVSHLGRLRDLKNRVFFGAITETTARMYE